ncbi:hypothetical protein DXG03_006092 [Asterophora parasitica]|uniref:beta-glucosidase n=1 Tax=Asterophora parasitica TaxID=117018 RepID=A0A9P7GGE6_9AGAR|nr:hypothetical protein DXG03_006092 [Asterophora parasitica]
MRQHGAAMGAEFRGKGVQVALGPMMNIQRAPAAGRNWEGFGGDPYLSGEASFEVINGMQSQGVQAEQWKQQHEIYAAPVRSTFAHLYYLSGFNLSLKQFLRSVQANVAAVMCSYNQSVWRNSYLGHILGISLNQLSPVNGTYACENDKALNGLLKGEFSFPGYVMSDWWATHSTSSINKGLDMTMPGDVSQNSGTTYFGQNLINAVNSGSVSQSRIDLSRYLLKQDSGFPAVNFNSWNSNAPGSTHVNVQGDHKNLIRTVGAASTVLLKNVNNILPLASPKTIGIIGNGAGPSSRGPNGYGDRAGNDGVLAVGWGSGTAEFPYLVTPLEAITAKAKTAGTTVSSTLSDTDLNAAANTAAGKDIAIVFITADSGEGYLTVEGNAGDRNNLQAWHGGDALVAKVASVNSKTIVVVNSVGPITMEPWINHVNGPYFIVPSKSIDRFIFYSVRCGKLCVRLGYPAARLHISKVWSGLPGQEAGKLGVLREHYLASQRYTGNAVTDVLYGVYNPSGRLPYTIGKAVTDYSAQVIYNSNAQTLQIPYNDGIFVDYRHFDKNNIAPRFEFGFGLSYTTFQYSGLTISGSTAGGSAPTGSALDPWLHSKVITVSFTIKNSGSVAGHEIPQLYTTLPVSANSAPKNLKGFDSVYLTPGQSKTVTIQLSRYDLSYWNVVPQRFQVPIGTHGISVGASSRDIRLTGSFAV